MRFSILLSVCCIFFYSADAQLSLLPQFGLENSMTKVRINDGSAFSPARAINMPQTSLRLNYLFKQGHGPYIALGTSRSVVNMTFHDPENVMNNFASSNGKALPRLEGGYMVSTPKIILKKGTVQKASASSSKTSAGYKSRCGSYVYKSGCHSKLGETPAKSSSKNTWMRMQPSLGIAYLPVKGTFGLDVAPGAAPAFVYSAGNMSTALVSGLGFEFGKGRSSSFIINVNYLNSLGKNDQIITSIQGNKPANTKFQSSTSMWNVRVGFPINLSKKKSTFNKMQSIRQQPVKSYEQIKKHCYNRCSKKI